MTDKQIIIDCVDVSGCKYYALQEHYDIESDGLWEACYSKDCKYSICANNYDCYYKQLLRKEQECEELKEEISKLQLNEYYYKNELKKYKKGIHKYRNLLKYEINNLRLSRREFLKMVGRYPKFEKDNIKLALDTFNRKLELIDNPSRYRKALDEIEGIAKNFGSYTAWQEQRINKILDIIKTIDK